MNSQARSERATPRIAVIGTGRFGQQHLREYLDLGADIVDVVGVADHDGALAARVAKQFGIGYSTEDGFRLLDELRPDGVSIVTDTDSHVPLTNYAVARGIRVLLEKPVAGSAADLDRFDSAAHQLVLPGHVLRFEPVHRELRRVVASGVLGQVVGISASRDRSAWHSQAYRTAHIALLTCIHDIDLAGWLSDARAVSVTAHARSSHTEDGSGPDVLFSQILASDASVWSIRSTWLLPDDSSSDVITVYGSAGTASLRATATEISLSWPTPTERVLTTPTTEANGLSHEIAHFLALVAGESVDPVISLTDAAHAVRVAEAMITSASRGGASVDVSPDADTGISSQQGPHS